MSFQNNENPESDKMADSYASALSQNNNNKTNDEPGPDSEISNVKPVFILESDIFGSSKPDKNNYLTHTELYKCIDQTIPANHLKGLQRVIGGLWRIYSDNEEDRQTLVVNSITVRKKRIQVYPRNPKFVERERPNIVRVRMKNVPLSADDGQLFRYLQNWKLNILNYHRERLRVDGFLTDCQTGDRIFHCEPFEQTIPRNVKIGKYLALIFYKGQINQDDTKIQCSKCLQKGHKKTDCNNDWKCKTCGENGHIAKDCTAEFDRGDQDVSEKSTDDSEDSDDDSDNDEIEQSQSIQESVEEPIKETIKTTEKKVSESESEMQTLEPKAQSGKKKKKKKQSKSKEKSQGLLDKYFDATPQQKSTKRSATTPTDTLHDRAVDSSKPRTS